MCVDIVTRTSVYGLSEVCVCVFVWECVRLCAQSEEDMFVCLHAYTVHTADTCALCAFFFCYVSMWRLTVPGLDSSVLAPVGLLRPASAQDQGVQELLPRPASLTTRQLQSLMPRHILGRLHPCPFPPSFPSWQNWKLPLMNIFYSRFLLLLTPQDM